MQDKSPVRLQTLLRSDSLRRILAVMRANQPITRKRLAQTTSLTKAGTAKAVDALIDAGVVREVGQMEAGPEGQRGRPTQMLEMAGEDMFAIGVAVKRDHIELALIDFANQIRGFVRLSNDFRDAKGDGLLPHKQLLRQIGDLLPTQQAVGRLLGIGLAYSGRMNLTSTRFEAVNDFASVEQADRLLTGLRQHWRVPVAPVAGIHASLLAERWYAASNRSVSSANLLYVNDRLGFGVLLAGAISVNQLGGNRWLGSLPMRSGAISRPPYRGCLAETADLSGMLSQMEGHSSEEGWWPRSGPEFGRKVETLFRLYEQRHPQACSIIERAFDDLGQVVRMLTALFWLDEVVIEGWTPAILADGMARVRRSLGDTLNGPADQPKPAPTIRSSSLGEKQQVIGAADAAVEQALRAHYPRNRASSGAMHIEIAG